MNRQFQTRHPKLIAIFPYCLAFFLINIAPGHASVLSSCQQAISTVAKKITKQLFWNYPTKKNDPIKIAQSLGFQVGNLARLRDEVAAEMDDLFDSRPLIEALPVEKIFQVRRQEFMQQIEKACYPSGHHSGFTSLQHAKDTSEIVDFESSNKLFFHDADGSVTGVYVGGYHNASSTPPPYLEFSPLFKLQHVGNSFLVVTEREDYPPVIRYRLFATKPAANAWLHRFEGPQARAVIKDLLLNNETYRNTYLIQALRENLELRRKLQFGEILAGFDQLIYELFGQLGPFSKGIFFQLHQNNLKVDIISQTKSDPRELLREFVDEEHFPLLEKSLIVISQRDENFRDSKGNYYFIPLHIQLTIPVGY